MRIEISLEELKLYVISLTCIERDKSLVFVSPSYLVARTSSMGVLLME